MATDQLAGRGSPIKKQPRPAPAWRQDRKLRDPLEPSDDQLIGAVAAKDPPPGTTTRAGNNAIHQEKREVVMGYDMHWRREDAEEKAATETARAAFYEACRSRDALPREVSERFNRAKAAEIGDWEANDVYEGCTQRYREAQDIVNAKADAHRSYFRLNIWGMGRYRDLMFKLGMAFNDDHHPKWPEAEDYGITSAQTWAVERPDDYPEVFSSLTPQQLNGANAYLAECQRILAWHGKQTPGIPLHKFGSNDGWIVTPQECEAAVTAWREHPNGEALIKATLESVEQREYWLRWISFLEGAVTHDGFEVW